LIIATVVFAAAMQPAGSGGFSEAKSELLAVGAEVPP
jgi:hypothetical protein